MKGSQGESGALSSEATKARGARRFDDLHVFQQARTSVNRIYAATRNPGFSRDRSLQDQIRRASVSIVSNIAESFERGSARSFAQALTIAKGSGGEVRAQIAVAFDQNYIDAKTHTALADECRRLSAGLANLIAYLKRRG